MTARAAVAGEQDGPPVVPIGDHPAERPEQRVGQEPADGGRADPRGRPGGQVHVGEESRVVEPVAELGRGARSDEQACVADREDPPVRTPPQHCGSVSTRMHRRARLPTSSPPVLARRPECRPDAAIRPLGMERSTSRRRAADDPAPSWRKATSTRDRSPARPSVLPGSRRRTTRSSPRCTCATCSRTTRPRLSASRSRRPGSTSTSRSTGSPTRRSTCSSRSPRSPGSSSVARRDVPRRPHQHHREPRRCCTPRCACPATPTLVVDGVDVVAEVHEVLDRMADVRRARPRRPLDRLHRQARSPPSSTSASAAPTSARSWPTRRCGTTATARSPCASCRTSTAPTSSRPPATSTRRRRCSSSRRRRSPRSRR